MMLPDLSVFRVATNLGRWNVDKKNTSRLSRYQTPRMPSFTIWRYSPCFIFLVTNSGGNFPRFFLIVPQAGVWCLDNSRNKGGLVYQLSRKRWCPLSRIGAIKCITIWPVFPISFSSSERSSAPLFFPT